MADIEDLSVVGLFTQSSRPGASANWQPVDNTPAGVLDLGNVRDDGNRKHNSRRSNKHEIASLKKERIGQDGHVIKLIKYDLSQEKKIWIANGYHYTLGGDETSHDIDFTAISHCWLDPSKPPESHESFDSLRARKGTECETVKRFLNDEKVAVWKKNRVLRTSEILSQLGKRHEGDPVQHQYEWFWMDFVSVNQSNDFAIRDASYVMSYVYHSASVTVVLHNNDKKGDHKEWDSKCWTLQEKYLSREFVHTHWIGEDTLCLPREKNTEMGEPKSLFELLEMSFKRKCNKAFNQDHVYCIRAFSKAVYERPVVYTLDIEVLISECAVSAAQYGDFSMFNATPREQAHGFGMIHPVWKSKYFSKLKASKPSNETALFLPKRVIPWVGFEFDGRLSKSFDIAKLDRIQMAGRHAETFANATVEFNWGNSKTLPFYEDNSPFRLALIYALMKARVPLVCGPYYTQVSKFMELMVRLMNHYVSDSIRKKILEAGVSFEEVLKWKEGEEGYLHHLEKEVVQNYLMVGPLMFHHAECLCFFCSAALGAVKEGKLHGDLLASAHFHKLVFVSKLRYGPEWRKLAPNLIPALTTSPTASATVIWLYLELAFVEEAPERASTLRNIIYSVSHTGINVPYVRTSNTTAQDFVQDADDPTTCKIMTIKATGAKFGSTLIYRRIGAAKEEVHNLASMISLKEGVPRPVTLDELARADSGFRSTLDDVTIVVEN
ncbi:hypothetical protein HDU78_010238 [Chytriomyces hyalinus]|nr:hypothetical protein HDU78_010238 [Chytriomyces hyalinus]